jgi:hypothetical protein
MPAPITNAYIERLDALKSNEARARGALMVWVRAVLDAREHGYQASATVWHRLREQHDAIEAAQKAMIDHLLERTNVNESA